MDDVETLKQPLVITQFGVRACAAAPVKIRHEGRAADAGERQVVATDG